jgi:hypothetical protein
MCSSGTPVAAVDSASCQILDLTLGALHLNLLGLVVELSQVDLSITGGPGAGNLLGSVPACSTTGSCWATSPGC